MRPVGIGEQWSEVRAKDIISAHQPLDGALLPIFHGLQDAFGYVPEQAIPLIAESLNLSRAEVHGIVTFYHDFRRQPPGKHVVKLCRAEACQSMGGDALAAALQEHLNIGWGETTPNGMVTLEPVFCLGLCACAPAAMVDGKVMGRLDETRLIAAIERDGE